MSPADQPLTILSLATSEKGAPLMRACHALGCRVLLVTLEIVHRIDLPHHAGLIVSSPSSERVTALMTEYADRFPRDFYAFAPAPDSPTH